MQRECALITGSSKGLGESLAYVFSKNNYNIILNGRNIKNLEKVRTKILDNGVDCWIVEGDISLDDTIERLVQESRKRGLSLLINNAAIGFNKSFERTDFNEIENLLRINFIAPIKLSQKVYEFFANKKSGTVININGGDGLRGRKFGSIYCASKYGLRGLTDSLRLEAKDKNIRLIGVHLSGMKTDMYAADGNDSRNCMELEEVAKVIYDISRKYPSLTVDEITIGRMKY